MAKIIDAEVAFRTQRLAMPLHLSSGVIEFLTEATASVVVEVSGRRATGRGAIYLSDLWAWPDSALSHDARDAALRGLCERIAIDLPQRFRHDDLHPLELGLQLHDWICQDLSIIPTPSILARAMCGSPFDAAIHDGAGMALGRSAMALYNEADTLVPAADDYFPESGACRAIAAALQPPRHTLPAWYVVGLDDSMGQNMAAAISTHGYGCFKLKITGRDNEADVGRTIGVFRKAIACGVSAPRITIDSNEANPSAESVVDYLERLEVSDAQAYSALEYIEQPTARDICQHPYDWRQVAQRKPVLLDEGLTELGMLDEARRQGYKGFALKTCKGHSMLLVSAAWALRNDMLISIQDLTNPGIALIHAALLGSHLPTINGAELNSPQYTPAANEEFMPRLRELFEPREGVHRLPRIVPHGLGSGL